MRKLLLVLFCLAGINCVYAKESKPLELTSADSGSTNTVKAGQAIVVTLEGNITTGYSWELDKIDGKSVVLDGEIEYKNVPRKDDGMVGAPGFFVAKFKTPKTGVSTVRLVYIRGFEKGEEPAEKFEATFVVKGKKSGK